ncbi:unnamed protein product, partial [marine sediment metagenome]
MALIDGLISYWKLDEASGNAADSHGANIGVASNIAYGTAGIINNCFSYNGTTSNVNCGHDASLNVTTGLTISFWIKSTPRSYNNFFLKQSSIYIRDADNGKISPHLWIDGSWRNFESASTHSAAAWSHWVFTFDGNDLRLYKNGVEDTNSPYHYVGSINITAN